MRRVRVLHYFMQSHQPSFSMFEIVKYNLKILVNEQIRYTRFNHITFSRDSSTSVVKLSVSKKLETKASLWFHKPTQTKEPKCIIFAFRSFCFILQFFQL